MFVPIFMFVLIFTSCSEYPEDQLVYPENQDLTYNANRKHKRFTSHFRKTIQEYESIINILRENQIIRDNMLKMYHALNNIYNEVIKKQKVSLQVLEKLEDQVITLADLMEKTDFSIEIRKKLQVIKDNLEDIQKEIIEKALEELTPKAKPAKKPEDTPKAEPAKKPKDTPKAEPAKKPEDTPKAKPAKKPEDTPKAKPAKKPEDTPKAKPAKKPEDTPKAKPAKKPEDTPKAEPAKKADTPKKVIKDKTEIITHIEVRNDIKLQTSKEKKK